MNYHSPLNNAGVGTPTPHGKSMYNFWLPQNFTWVTSLYPWGTDPRTSADTKSHERSSILHKSVEQCILGFPTKDQKQCFQSTVGWIHGCENWGYGGSTCIFQTHVVQGTTVTASQLLLHSSISTCFVIIDGNPLRTSPLQ